MSYPPSDPYNFQQAGGYPPPQANYGYPPQSGYPPPAGFGQPPPQGFGQPPTQGWGAPQPAYGQPPQGYGQPPTQGWGAPQAAYGQPGGYGQPAAQGWGSAPAPQAAPNYAPAPCSAPLPNTEYIKDGEFPHQTGAPQHYAPAPQPAQVPPEILALYQVGPGEPPLPPPYVTGTRKAVVIGINYLSHQKGQLRGCIPDANNVEAFLVSRNFPKQNIRKLTDDNPNAMPTRANMIAAMQWLVQGAQPGDSLFFHYSGHGDQEKATGPVSLEEDGMNETIIPVDYRENGMIPDDLIHKLLVKPLPPGVRLTAIFDSCHSGTVMDLPYIYRESDGEYKHAHKSEEGGFFKRHHLSALTSVAGIASLVGTEVLYQGKKKAKRELLAMTNTSNAMVMMIAGCRDDQTSADVTNAFGQSGSTGAMSYSFITAITANSNHSWASLIRAMRDILHRGDKKFTQMPQLSMGRNLNPNLPVVI